MREMLDIAPARHGSDHARVAHAVAESKDAHAAQEVGLCGSVEAVRPRSATTAEYFGHQPSPSPTP